MDWAAPSYHEDMKEAMPMDPFLVLSSIFQSTFVDVKLTVSVLMMNPCFGYSVFCFLFCFIFTVECQVKRKCTGTIFCFGHVNSHTVERDLRQKYSCNGNEAAMRFESK